MLTALAVANYRSLRDLIVPLSGLTVITGENGSGKSNLYRALRLLADASHDRLIASLAREGGLASTLWAGPERFSRAMLRGEQPVQGTRRSSAIRLALGFQADDFGYALDCGLPTSAASAFALDPEIKSECIWAGPLMRPASLLVDRRGPGVRVRTDDSREWRTLPQAVLSSDSVISHAIDPRESPEALTLRERMRGWRFYDQLRSDRDSPARQPRIGTRTVALAGDGGDLAAALQTIVEIGDRAALEAAVDDAFPGARLGVDVRDGRFEVRFHQPGLLRPLTATELSDGTLRYLLWVAALLSPRPPELMVLNEPETSLHPDLLPALGRLILAATRTSQVVVVTHANRLAATLDDGPGCLALRLTRELGATRLGDDSTDIERPAWRWPVR